MHFSYFWMMEWALGWHTDKRSRCMSSCKVIGWLTRWVGGWKEEGPMNWMTGCWAEGVLPTNL